MTCKIVSVTLNEHEQTDKVTCSYWPSYTALLRTSGCLKSDNDTVVVAYYCLLVPINTGCGMKNPSPKKTKMSQKQQGVLAAFFTT